MHISKKYAALFSVYLLLVAGPAFAVCEVDITGKGYFDPATGDYRAQSLISSNIDPSVPECQPGGFDKIITNVVCLTNAIVLRTMFDVYCSILPPFENMIIPAAIILYLILYGAAVMFGIGRHSLGDAVIRFLKIFIIAAIATVPDYAFFWVYNVFFGALDGFAVLFANALGSSGGGPVFASGSTIEQLAGGAFAQLGVIFQSIVGYKTGSDLMSLFVACLLGLYAYGPILALLILFGGFAMIVAFLRVIITYATAIMFLSLLLMFTPIFVTAALFSWTFPLFQGWVASLIAYTLQPILIMAFVLAIGTSLEIAALGDALLSHDMDGDGINEANLIDQGQSYSFNPIGVWEWTILRDTEKLNAAVIEEKYRGTGKNPREELGKDLIAFVIGWIILGSIVSGFLDMVPELATQLGRWKRVRVAANIGRSLSMGAISGQARNVQEEIPGLLAPGEIAGVSTIGSVGRGAAGSLGALVTRPLGAVGGGASNLIGRVPGGGFVNRIAGGTLKVGGIFGRIAIEISGARQLMNSAFGGAAPKTQRRNIP